MERKYKKTRFFFVLSSARKKILAAISFKKHC